MFTIFKPGLYYDFMGKQRFFVGLSAIIWVLSVVLICVPGVLKWGLDFSGGHEILVSFDKPITSAAVRSEVDKLKLGDTSVQSYSVPNSPKTFFLLRVQRSQTFGAQEIKELNDAFLAKYGDHFRGPLRYNSEMGNLFEVEFTGTSTHSVVAEVDTSSAAISAIVEGTNHNVQRIARIGRPDQNRFSVTLSGIDATIVKQLRTTIDPGATTIRNEFVGPTVGKQLRDDGILACFYALLFILIYVGFRFDFAYGAGAILCVFHDLVVTVAILALLGREFSMATIAGLLTLIGYSLNDTIIVFDRIRETAGKAHGESLKEIINRAISETLARTILTSVTVLLSSICLMAFGGETVLFEYGLIMTVGVLLGTYSSIYVAAPIFYALRMRFGSKEAPEHGRGGPARAVLPQTRS